MPDERAPREQRFEQRMTDAEALMWNVEKDPWLNPNGGVLVILRARSTGRVRAPYQARSTRCRLRARVSRSAGGRRPDRTPSSTCRSTRRLGPSAARCDCSTSSHSSTRIPSAVARCGSSSSSGPEGGRSVVLKTITPPPTGSAWATGDNYLQRTIGATLPPKVDSIGLPRPSKRTGSAANGRRSSPPSPPRGTFCAASRHQPLMGEEAMMS